MLMRSICAVSFDLNECNEIVILDQKIDSVLSFFYYVAALAMLSFSNGL